MKHKCKNCGHFERGKGCTTCYPPAKCSGNLAIDCEDFITPERERARQEKLWGKPRTELGIGKLMDSKKIVLRGEP